ncbi:MAG: STAS domain-containing protein [Mycolicibacterium sp.]|nr:STAS domain-containing protein [Mycolicibacterium sp.]
MSGSDQIITSVERRDGISVLVVSGKIDAATAPVLDAAIARVLQVARTPLVIDLSAVTYLASAGLRILVATQKAIGNDFAVVAQSPATRRPIEITRLDELLVMYPTVDEALTAIRPNAD